MTEKRHARRARRHLRISWQDEAVHFDGITLDICQGGVFVITNGFFPPRSIIDIEIRLDGDFSLRCHGEVVWVNQGQVEHYPPGFGIQFLDLERESLDLLLPFCTQTEQNFCGM